ncbi:MAG TPA: protein translocase subunit SecD [Blastocatellia bacterium]|nr:protein translocase subunit SecD [Blastocatellia bacterium]
MQKKIRTRAIIILAVTLIGLYWVTMPSPGERWPNAADFTSWSRLKENLATNIKLGLDLRGGSHLVMQVQTDDRIKRITDENVAAARAKLQEKNWPFTEVKATGVAEITVTVPDSARNTDISDELESNFNSHTSELRGWTWSEKGNSIVFKFDEAVQNIERERATETALQIIENRVNAFGVTEPTIQRYGGKGTYQILIQMPGIDDPERVKNTLNADSNLELKLVAKGTSINPPYPTKDAAELAATSQPGGAEGYEVLFYRERAGEGKPAEEGWLVLEKTPVVTGLDMRDAKASSNQYGGASYEIEFWLTPGGAQRFGDATGKHIGDFLAIVLNNEVKSAAIIQSRITDNGQITGSFTKRQAEDLALILRSGALPAKAIYLEERTVGPSLGADSIRQGVTASVTGLLAVILFMLFYYRLSGVNAVLALTLNLVLLLAAMVAFEATLTLPGIAGVILTIGMGVDSNVLIFERIREEMRNGKVVASAVDVGFAKAFLTIIDTHVTTIVSAVFLFVFGTGPIRGFAVTLVVGLLANLFTAIFVSRTIFMWHLNRSARVETLSI